jgi:hypothetical protein
MSVFRAMKRVGLAWLDANQRSFMGARQGLLGWTAPDGIDVPV